MTRSSARTALVQALGSKQIARLQSRPLKHPVIRRDRPIRRTRHDARHREHHAQQIRFRFDALGHPAFRADSLGPQAADVAVVTDQPVVTHLDLAVHAVSAEVHQPPALLEDPPLEPLVHGAGPVLRVRADDQQLVLRQIEHAGMELRFRVDVVVEPFPLHPSQETPLGRSDMAGGPAFNRIGDLLGQVDMVDQLRPVERERQILRAAPGLMAVVDVALQLLSGVDRGRGRQFISMDVVAAAAKIVVGVPGDVREQHRRFRARFGRGDDPGKAKLPA